MFEWVASYFLSIWYIFFFCVLKSASYRFCTVIFIPLMSRNSRVASNAYKKYVMLVCVFFLSLLFLLFCNWYLFTLFYFWFPFLSQERSRPVFFKIKKRDFGPKYSTPYGKIMRACVFFFFTLFFNLFFPRIMKQTLRLKYVILFLSRFYYFMPCRIWDYNRRKNNYRDTLCRALQQFVSKTTYCMKWRL